MSDLPPNPDASQARHVELILQQLDALPTLNTVAVRLLELTSADDTEASEVIRLVGCDPSLSSKILKLCRCSPRGRASKVTSLDRAVVLMGFEAIRSAVLSVQVFEFFDDLQRKKGEASASPPVFDREQFWYHSLAVGVLCEHLAGCPGLRGQMEPSEAYMAGLLHDLGLLALHVVLPRSVDQVCQFADTHGVSLDQACRRLIGMDTHTAGKRLAEHWRLPRSLGDVLWLNGQRYESLPDLPHRKQIALVTLADVIARNQMIAPAGHGPGGESIDELRGALGLRERDITKIVDRLHEEIAARAAGLGMKVQRDTVVLLRSISRANDTLGRLNEGMRQKALLADRQAEALGAIVQFHDGARPGCSVVDVLGMVVRSASGVFGGSFFAMLYHAGMDNRWQLIQFAGNGRVLQSELITPPPEQQAIEDLADSTQVSMEVLGLQPWISRYFEDPSELQNVRLLPLRCGWGISAVLLHNCAVDGRHEQWQLDALSRTWGASVAAAGQHEGARRLGEQLADSNRVLTEAQHELARKRALATLGEMAAGAAHEMNNPLCVISGRSQILAEELTDSDHQLMARQIEEQSHRLSDMISALRAIVEPARPRRMEVDLVALLPEIIDDVRRRTGTKSDIKMIVDPSLPAACVDPQHMRVAVGELLCNAVEAEGSRHVQLSVQIDPFDDRLMIQVQDDGVGLSDHVLAHAFDPFFSAKPAGRQPGLGLDRARRLVEAHGGRLTLENAPDRGALATIRLADWRVDSQTRSHVA
jgi:signal transduction histidine kinase/HD-like signal output (HDOD) protein